MKLVLVTWMLFVSSALYAQPQATKAPLPSRQELSRAQASYIAKSLGFDEETTRKFEGLYCMQQQEIWALSPQETARSSERSDAEVDRAIQERFERSEQILAIRKKYYKEYRRFLSPQQVERIYQLERHAMGRLGSRIYLRRGSLDSLKRHPSTRRSMRIYRRQR